MLIPLLAGCAGPALEPSQPAPLEEQPTAFGAAGPIPLSGFPLEVPTFVQLHVSERRSGEPTIGITRGAAVFYPAIEFDLGAPGATSLPRTEFLRSVDGGATWTDVSPQLLGADTHASSFDPYVYADPMTGRVYAMDMGPHVACNKVSWSDDDGWTWFTRDGACPLPVADHPTIFAGPRIGIPATPADRYPNNVYLCSNQIADVQCSVSLDGGYNWLPSQPVFVGAETEGTDPRICGSLTGHGHASWIDGTVYLGRGYCGVPMVAVSHDGGLNWETTIISANEDNFLRYEHDVSIGTDAAGVAYAFWLGNNDTRAFVSVSEDHGRTWSTPLDVTAPGVTAAKLPSLVAGAEGRVAIQYVATTTPSGWDVHEYERGDDDFEAEYLATTWNAYVTIIADANTNPRWAHTFVNDPDQPLKRGGCQGRCFGDAGGMYDFLDLDIDPRTGQLWSALVDVCTVACDEPGADAHAFQRAFGAVGKQIGGSFLLDEPIPEA